jgi:pimeloyl-ACP methyl ester carboxylesterase
MSTFVLVHGAWHSGDEFEPTASIMRGAGHCVLTPTLRGNGPNDAKTVGLDDAIRSLLDYIEENDLSDIVLAGHSYGGMIITAVADHVPDRIRRLIYWNALVPRDGESVNDLLPPHYVSAFDANFAERGDGSLTVPFAIWREAYMNDCDLETATRTFGLLNPHPYKTFTDRISLSSDPAAMTIPKSYINGTDDSSMPHTFSWHPRMSQRLGLFRLIQIPGGHELCFSNPSRLAQAFLDAGRD